MTALSLRQPWAWLVLEGLPPKDYENRAWPKKYLEQQLALCPVGSWFLIHAAKGMTNAEFEEACAFANRRFPGIKLPHKEDLKRGGIVGMVKLDGIVRKSVSPWFTGPLALRLREPYPMPFQPCRGQLGFFQFCEEPIPSPEPEFEEDERPHNETRARVD